MHYDVGVHSLRMADMTEEPALETVIEVARALPSPQEALTAEPPGW